MTPEERQQLRELMDWKQSLEMSHTIPLNIDQSFRGRFINDIIQPASSSKSATSENQAVNEGGSSTYSVLKPPDAFLQLQIGTTIYYIPVFT